MNLFARLKCAFACLQPAKLAVPGLMLPQAQAPRHNGVAQKNLMQNCRQKPDEFKKLTVLTSVLQEILSTVNLSGRRKIFGQISALLIYNLLSIKLQLPT